MIEFCQLEPTHAVRVLAPDFEKEYRALERIVVCPLSTQHRALRRIGPLHHFVTHNDRKQHVIWGKAIAVHESLILNLEKEGFTGFRARPAKVTFQDGQTSDEYREFIVTGWAGVVRPESGMKLLESCPACLWKNYGPISDFNQVIDWDQWTGEDFFFVWPLVGHKLCTQRAAKWLERSGIQSFQLEAGFKSLERGKESLNYDLPRGALSEYLPEDLAIKYGRPLGLE